MKNIYFVVVEEENGKHFAFADAIRTNENAKHSRYFLDPKYTCIEFCESRKKAEEIALAWNESYKKNGTYLF